MKIKIYSRFNAGCREANQKELGNDAVILHSKQVKKRKWLGLRSQQAVEVIAVLDRDVRKREKRRRLPLEK